MGNEYRTGISRGRTGTGFSTIMDHEAAVIENAYEDALADPGRRDLRDLTTYTIDPVDAKDYDDAISVEKHGETGDIDGYSLYVHVADVASCLPADGIVDALAQERGFTRYRVNGWRTEHMLPERLAGDLFSLTGESITNTVEFRFDEDGELQDSEIYRSIIEPDRGMSFGEATGMMHHDTDRLHHADQSVAEELLEMKFLSLRLNQRRTGEHGQGAGDPAQFIIEEAMVAANQRCAEELTENEYNGLYRVHGDPIGDWETHAQDRLDTLGYQKEADWIDSSGDAEGVFESFLHDHEHDRDMVDHRNWRGFRAQYSPFNLGHEALELDSYSHFTSPIRRYVDILNWRALHGDGPGTERLTRIADALNRRENEQKGRVYSVLDV